MAFSQTSIVSGPYAPDGATTAFPFTFLALSADEVEVVVIDGDGIETSIPGFTVQGVGDPAGGQVVFQVPPVYPDQLLYVRAKPAFSQPVDLENQGDFNPADIGAGLDRVTQLAIWLRDRLGTSSVSTGGQGTGGDGSPVQWANIIGKPVLFPPAPHTHLLADITDFANFANTVAARNLANVSSADFLAKAVSSGATGGGGGGAGYGASKPLSSYGTLDLSGVTIGGNDAAFTAAEADPATLHIYIPEGTLKTTLTADQLTKGYVGDGSIIAGNGDGAFRPANFSYMKVKPTTWGVQGIDGWFRGDQRFSDGGEWKIIGPGVRLDLTARYFESNTIPHHHWLDVFSGHSGLSSRLQNAVTIGQVSATLWADAAKFPIGTKFQFGDGQDAPTGTVYTIDQAPAGAVIHFTPAIDTAKPVGTPVIVGKRTWAGVRYIKVTANADAGGDVYGDLVRANQGYTAWAGQKHWENTGTVGQYGGDINFQANSSGSYATGWESQYIDNGNDVAVIGQVDSYIRTNDAGARGVMWLGMLKQSGGTKPADAAYVLTGPWRAGLDTVRADLTTFSTTGDLVNAAINTAQGQNWVMNSKALPGSRGSDPNGYYPLLWGSTPGDMFIGSGQDTSGDFIAIWYNRAAPNNGRLRLRPGILQCNVPIACGADINAGTNISLGGAAGAGDCLVAFGPGTGNYIRFNTSNNRFEFYRGFALVSSI